MAKLFTTTKFDDFKHKIHRWWWGSWIGFWIRVLLISVPVTITLVVGLLGLIYLLSISTPEVFAAVFFLLLLGIVTFVVASLNQ